MKKDDIFNILNKIELKKDEFVVTGEASMVAQDVIKDTDNIVIGVDDKVFKKTLLNNIPNVTYINTSIKKENIVKIKDYNFLNLDEVLNQFTDNNKKEDSKNIKALDLYLCLKDNKRYEKALYEKGINLIAGVDEVGRGPLVGPVVAAAVILPKNYTLEGLTDSKKLSEKKREYFYDIIKKDAISIGVGIISNEKIDEVNIYEATKLAMYDAINNLDPAPEHILIDAMKLQLDNTTSIIKGDIKSISISAASVIAKVTRDRMMDELDKEYPMYNFKKNKGYPTKDHIKAIEEYGIISLHRKSYSPVKANLNKINNTRGTL